MFWIVIIEIIVAIVILLINLYANEVTMYKLSIPQKWALLFCFVLNLLFAFLELSTKDNIGGCILYIALSIPWAVWFNKQTFNISKGYLLTPRQRFSDKEISVNGKVISFGAGDHTLAFPAFKKALREDSVNHDQKVTFGIQNPSIKLDNLKITSSDRLKGVIELILITFGFKEEFAYQVDLYNDPVYGKKEEGILKFITSISKNAVNDYLGDFPVEQIDTDAKLRNLIEKNGGKKAILEEISRQLSEITIRNDIKTENFQLYKPLTIRTEGIDFGEAYNKGQSKIKDAELENTAKGNLNTGLKSRADQSGVSVKEQAAIENGKVEDITINGDKSGNTLYSVGSSK